MNPRRNHMTSETHELEDTYKKTEPHDSHLYTSFSKQLQQLFDPRAK